MFMNHNHVLNLYQSLKNIFYYESERVLLDVLNFAIKCRFFKIVTRTIIVYTTHSILACLIPTEIDLFVLILYFFNDRYPQHFIITISKTLFLKPTFLFY